MATFGQRLGLAIRESRLKKLSRFHEAMVTEKVEGVSRPAIYRYLQDEASPTIAWAVAAAKVLGVNLAWLMSGEGDPWLGVAMDQWAHDVQIPMYVMPDLKGLWALLYLRARHHLEAPSASWPASRQAERLRDLRQELANHFLSMFDVLGVDPNQLAGSQMVQAQALWITALNALIPGTAHDRLQAAGVAAITLPEPKPPKRPKRRTRTEKSR
jgi:AcrR family transcriptional regulator